MPSPKIAKRRLPLLCLAGLGMFAAVACSDDSAEEWPGNQTVHKRIAGLTDCAELQSEFDTAMQNLEREKAGTDRYTIVLSYSEHAEERRQELGC